MSLHITSTKKNITNVEECKIDVTLRNGQNMRCELKGMVNNKLQGWETVKLNYVLYVLQSFNNLLSVFRHIPKVFNRWILNTR